MIHKESYQLCTYNSTNITQLGTYTVFIKFENIKKCCVFFVVPSNRQAQIGMPNVASLEITKINIDSIQAERLECKVNNKQEVQTNANSCTNMMGSAINKQDANIQRQQDTPINTINYFTSSSNTDADKRKSSEMKQIIYDKFGDVFNSIGCFKGTFSLQLKPDSRLYQTPPRYAVYALQKPFKEELKWP